jgi:heat shock protein HslJ
MRKMLPLLAVALAITACASSTTIDTIRDRDWTLTWVQGFDSMPAGVAVPTLRLGADGRLGANTGCNSAGASYTAEGDRLTIGAVMSTKRACAISAGNQLEHTYLGAIERTRRFRVASDQLELLDDSGAVVARFR